MDVTIEMLGEPDLEEEAHAEIDNILVEITGRILSNASTVRAWGVVRWL